MIIGNREFDTKNSKYIMAILNVTPDSFSDGGRYNALDAALKHTEDMIAQGADIIDIGGESTRPGYTMISDEEEIERVVPVIEAVKKRFDIPISLDTYKSRVAQAGIEAGADLINDIWGFKYDENMAKVVSDNQVACCLMHNRQNTDYTDYVKNVTDDLKESVDIAVNAGVSKDKVFPHSFRHLFARTYYSLQKDIVRLADILGHSSINTTRIYTIESGITHRKQLQKLGFLRL